MMGYGRYGYGMMGVGIGWLMMLGFTLLVVLGIVALFRYIRHTNVSHSQGSNANNSNFTQGGGNALNILNERYAKGELSSEDYNRMKSEIQK
ncbi:MAG TPA: SHOCT domain-containing protein [Ruminiclostridium sp.]|nr:SHOCT domain-containing protein [Ruminiclostridium sp.]